MNLFQELTQPPLGQGMTPWRARQALKDTKPKRRKYRKGRRPDHLCAFSFPRLRDRVRAEGLPEGLPPKAAEAVQLVIDSKRQFLSEIARDEGMPESSLRASLRRAAGRMKCPPPR